MGNKLIIFQNTYVRSYNCQIAEIDISNLETANGLIKIPIDKPANKEIPVSLDYLKPQKSY